MTKTPLNFVAGIILLFLGIVNFFGGMAQFTKAEIVSGVTSTMSGIGITVSELNRNNPVAKSMNLNESLRRDSEAIRKAGISESTWLLIIAVGIFAACLSQLVAGVGVLAAKTWAYGAMLLAAALGLLVEIQDIVEDGLGFGQAVFLGCYAFVVWTGVETRSGWGSRSSGRWWNDPRLRALAYQALAVVLVLSLFGYLIANTVENLRRQNIASGFGFLDLEAGFAISESAIAFTPADSYGRAFMVGLFNTFKVAVLGVVFATVLGVLIGVARLSSNWLVARLATSYVEVLRNLPLLLQLFVWYGLITVSLPLPREALSPIEGVYLSNRGFQIPALNTHGVYSAMGIALLVAAVAAVVLGRWAKGRQARTGQPFPTLSVGFGLIVGAPLLVWLLGGAPIDLDMPQKSRFNITGGHTLSPEFAALLLGLSTYTAAFIAEIVRSGILAVSWGQSEAALSLGLSRTQTLRLVILPQALRIIVPPTTSQYLNLVKNSSLAVAIGYPDLVSIGNTALNQTGQAVEAVAIFMIVYLLISLAISAFMNWYNRRIALVER